MAGKAAEGRDRPARRRVATDDLPFTAFGTHYRRKYGEPVGKIALDLGYTCPNRRLGGCIFCSPRSFTP